MKSLNVMNYGGDFLRSELHDMEVVGIGANVKTVISESLFDLKQEIIDFLLVHDVLPAPWVVSHIADIVLELRDFQESTAASIFFASQLVHDWSKA